MHYSYNQTFIIRTKTKEDRNMQKSDYKLLILVMAYFTLKIKWLVPVLVSQRKSCFHNNYNSNVAPACHTHSFS